MPRIEPSDFETFAAGFQRSRKGNHWRKWESINLTVFKRPDGCWGYCIADEFGPRFGTSRYKSADAAMESLFVELGLDDNSGGGSQSQSEE